MHCCCCCSVTSVVSDSVRPHRRQPTRLRRPWDSPGKNAGVGCHFLLQMRESKTWKWGHSVVSDSSGPHGLQPTRLLHPWDLPGKSTGVGCHRLLWLDAQMYLIEVFVCISLMANELIIFSCIYLPSVYPLWWNVCFVCFVHLKKISLFSFWLHWVLLWLHVGFL